MVEPQIVILVVAGSSPVDHPTLQDIADDMESIEERIQYHFRQPALLKEALTHASLKYETKVDAHDNQRLEFLGDAVLQLVLSELVYNLFSKNDEGILTKMRTRLVSTRTLGKIGKQMNFGAYIYMGRGEEINGGRSRESTLADVVEALIGAIYLDGSLEAARKFVLHIMDGELKLLNTEPSEINPKGDLQEILQAYSTEAPIYEIIASAGPDHQKHFEAIVLWKGQQLGKGSGARKKDAEAAAARSALNGPEYKTILRTQKPIGPLPKISSVVNHLPNRKLTL
jgi:ribonuclease-3